MADNGTSSNGRPTLLSVGKMVLAQLPPAFVLLLLINTGFLYFVMNFMETQMDNRMQLALKIIDHCLNK